MFNSMALKGTSIKFYRTRQRRVWGLKAHNEYVQVIRKPGAP
jgi:hypothetical protein